MTLECAHRTGRRDRAKRPGDHFQPLLSFPRGRRQTPQELGKTGRPEARAQSWDWGPRRGRDEAASPGGVPALGREKMLTSRGPERGWGVKETAWFSVGGPESDTEQPLCCGRAPCPLGQVRGVLPAGTGRCGAGPPPRAPEASNGPCGQPRQRREIKPENVKGPRRHNLRELALK